MACDLIVASETAVFGQPETALGLFLAPGHAAADAQPSARRSPWT